MNALDIADRLQMLESAYRRALLASPTLASDLRDLTREQRRAVLAAYGAAEAIQIATSAGVPVEFLDDLPAAARDQYEIDLVEVPLLFHVVANGSEPWSGPKPRKIERSAWERCLALGLRTWVFERGRDEFGQPAFWYGGMASSSLPRLFNGEQLAFLRELDGGELAAYVEAGRVMITPLTDAENRAQLLARWAQVSPTWGTAGTSWKGSPRS